MPSALLGCFAMSRAPKKVTNLKKQDPGAKSIGGGRSQGVSLRWLGYAARRKLHRGLGKWDPRCAWLNPYLGCREWTVASPHEATYLLFLCSNTRDAAVNGAAISHLRIPLLAATEIATHTPPRMARKGQIWEEGGEGGLEDGGIATSVSTE